MFNFSNHVSNQVMFARLLNSLGVANFADDEGLLKINLLVPYRTKFLDRKPDQFSKVSVL